MIYFKACPRCQGDMKINHDLYGRFLECLQCGHEINLKDEAGGSSLWAAATATASTKAKEKVRAA
ncbi:MAG: hypothetical protein HY680_10095 [Chloroflexi bacterium]|nr:hypothetical protein [Chloroflexota bacterium]